MLSVEYFWDEHVLRYYISYNGMKEISDLEIIEYLNIKCDNYIKILKKYGAYRINNIYWFKTYNECKKCINSKELLPYIMMKKLME